MKTELTAKEKGYYREKALDTASRIRPIDNVSIQYNQNAPLSKISHASVTKEVLEQAEIIYKWLVA